MNVEYKHPIEIKLTNEQFDEFIEGCENPRPISPEILAASEALDEEGLVFHVRRLD